MATKTSKQNRKPGKAGSMPTSIGSKAIVDTVTGETVKQPVKVEAQDPPATCEITAEPDGRAVVGRNRVHSLEAAIELARKWGWPDDRITVDGQPLAEEQKATTRKRGRPATVKAPEKPKARWTHVAPGHWKSEILGSVFENKRSAKGQPWVLTRDGKEIGRSMSDVPLAAHVKSLVDVANGDATEATVIPELVAKEPRRTKAEKEAEKNEKTEKEAAAS